MSLVDKYDEELMEDMAKLEQALAEGENLARDFMNSYGADDSVVLKVIIKGRGRGEPVTEPPGSGKRIVDLMEWLESMRPVYQSFPFRISISRFNPFDCDVVFENFRHSINQKALTLKESEVLLRFMHEVMHVNYIGWEAASIASFYPTPELMSFTANLIIKYNPDDLFKPFNNENETSTTEWWQSLKQQIAKECNIPRLEYIIEQMHLPEVDVESVVSSGDIEGLIKALDYSVFQVKDNVIQALVEIGKPAVQPLILALEDDRSNLREAAAETLGRIKDPQSIEPLVQLLKDDDLGIRLTAERSLRDLGKPAVPSLIEALKNDNNNIRNGAATVLGRMKDIRATDPLCRLLKSEHRSDRIGAAEALEKIGNPTSTGSLIEALKDRDRDVRRMSVKALGVIGDVRALMPLVNVLKKDKDSRQYVWQAVVDVFRKSITKDSKEIAEPAVREFVTMLGDDYAWSYASSVLITISYPVIDSLIGVLHSSKNRRIRKRVPQILAEKVQRESEHYNEVLSVLCQVLQDKDKEVKISAAFALEKLQDPTTVEALTRALDDKDIRYFADLALKKIQKDKD